MNRVIKVKNLRLAALKYYKVGKGVELTDPVGYVILEKFGENLYVNPIEIAEEYPTFERLPYANVTKDGEDYGSKLRLVNDIDKDGPCWVLFKGDLRDSFGKDVISEEELENYILNSADYFPDRLSIAKERLEIRPSIKLFRIILNDTKSAKRVNSFFEERGVQLQKVR